MRNTVRVLTTLLAAVAFAAGFAHLISLPNKLPMSRDDYFTAQQVYRGWALLGIPILAALLLSVTLAVLDRKHRSRFRLSVAAAACLALALGVFFAFTFPANQETQNWTVAPPNWERLRSEWEYSHAVGAGLYFAALTALVLSLARSPDG